jgi:hypothetical protein
MYQNIYSKTAKFSKNYQFKASTKSNISKIFEDLNQKWVSSLNIAEVKNTKIADFRKTVKINALKAAKKKQIICWKAWEKRQETLLKS